MTGTITPPSVRPAAATAWTVTAVMWGVLTIGFGGVRLHQEWSDYRRWQDILDDTSSSATWGYAYVEGWAELTLLGLLAGAVWIGLALAWLGVAVARGVTRPRPRSVAAQLTAVVVMVVVAAVATTVLVHDSQALPEIPAEARLLTPAFLWATVLLLDGVAALALARWPLQDRS